MKFGFNKTVEFKLEANNLNLFGRWILKNPDCFEKNNEVGRSVRAFDHTASKDEGLRKTALSMAEDENNLNRVVLVKTVCYDEQDLNSTECILKKRKILESQIDILNALSSNMLPEPLDYFEITNNCDRFGDSVSEEIRKSEPVLILDYIPGEVLADKIRNPRDKTFYRDDKYDEKNEKFIKNTANINIEMVMRLAADILAFEIEMYEKGYAYTTLSPDHIVILGDNKPRFTGLGRICHVSSGVYDQRHINFGRHLKTYGAPEFNRENNNFGISSNVKANISYNLGTLIAGILLARNDFDDRLLNDGAYDYMNAAEDRQIIINSLKKGKQTDELLCRLMNPDPLKRITDLKSILNNLETISGDAQNAVGKDTVHYGKVKFFDSQKGFGYVTDNNDGKEYRYHSNTKNAPYYEEDDAAFTVREYNGKLIVNYFLRTDIVLPKAVK